MQIIGHEGTEGLFILNSEIHSPEFQVWCRKKKSEKNHAEFHCRAQGLGVFSNNLIFRKCITRYFSLFRKDVAFSLCKKNLPRYCSCAINSYFIPN